MKVDMQAKPLVITISCATGRDAGGGNAIKCAVDAISDANPDLSFCGISVRMNGPGIQEYEAKFRPIIQDD